MAKRNSESGGRRGGSSSPRSGKSKSSEKPYKKFDKSDAKPSFRKRSDDSDQRGSRPFSSAPRSGGSSDRPYKKSDKPFDKSGPRRESSSSDRRDSRSFGRPGADSRGGDRKFDKPYGKSSSRREEGGDSERRPRSFGKPGESSRPYKKFDGPSGGSRRGEGDSERQPRSFGKSEGGKRFDKPFDNSSKRRDDSERAPRSFGASRSSSEKPYKKFDREGGSDDRSERRPRAEGSDDRSERRPRPAGGDDRSERRSRPADGDDRSERRPRPTSASGEKPYRKVSREESDSKEDGSKGSSYGLPYKRPYTKGEVPIEERGEEKKFNPAKSKRAAPGSGDPDIIRLNKFIANSGMCSRREADEYIKMGLVSVNGKVITELGHKINRADEVRYEDKVLKTEKHVYILMNKPKGYLTTTKDPQERNTVMTILEGQVKERVYPVGRLDRNTTGLLLLTNDGDLADKLMHPSYKAKKIYKVELDRPLTKADFQKILDGVYLDEGRAIVDDLAIIDGDSKTIGIEIHIGWNRVVRRIFEAIGYEVVKLDRTFYAGLDKKELPRGHFRPLKSEEIVMLKHYKK